MKYNTKYDRINNNRYEVKTWAKATAPEKEAPIMWSSGYHDVYTNKFILWGMDPIETPNKPRRNLYKEIVKLIHQIDAK